MLRVKNASANREIVAVHGYYIGMTSVDDHYRVGEVSHTRSRE